MIRAAWFLLTLAFIATAASPESGYVGSKACFGCHAEIYRSYIKTAMGHSLSPAADLNKLSGPTSVEVKSARSDGNVGRMFQENSDWFQSEQRAQGFSHTEKLDYLVGSGANGFTPLIRREQGLFQAPLSYYSKTGTWDWSPGYEQRDLGFSRPVPEQCIVCHSGRAAPIGGRKNLYANPPFHELAIGCENCHGPGAQHVRAPKHDHSIVNPGKLSPRLAENICMNCHQGGDARVLQPGRDYLDYRPGEWLLDTVAIFKTPAKPEEKSEGDLLEHNAAMKMSRCFRASNGKLSCLTCHDPHVQPEQRALVGYFRQKCFTCHTDESCSFSKKTRLSQTPPDNCIGCHMPRRDVTVISHAALTNHRIPARISDPTPVSDQENGNDLILLNPAEGRKTVIPDVMLLRAYSEVAERNPSYQAQYVELLDQLAHRGSKEPFVEAALGHKLLAEGKAEEALPHLSIGLALNETAAYEDMAKALSNLGQEEEALTCLERATEGDPFNDVLLKKLVLEYIKLKRYSEAKRQMQRYVDLFPEDQFMRGLLARVTN
jgi:predicted CXXCH cytochrome family protein